MHLAESESELRQIGQLTLEMQKEKKGKIWKKRKWEKESQKKWEWIERKQKSEEFVLQCRDEKESESEESNRERG